MKDVHHRSPLLGREPWWSTCARGGSTSINIPSKLARFTSQKGGPFPLPLRAANEHIVHRQ